CLDLVLGANKQKVALDKAFVEVVMTHLKERAGENADFWSEASRIELEKYEAISRRGLARELRRLNSQYEHLHDRATSARMWASVYDNGSLVLGGYARQASKREQSAAGALMKLLR